MSERSNSWPAGYRAALCVSIDVDGPYGELNYRSPDDTYWIAQTEYDPVGVSRLLGLLADRDLSATFCWVARAAEDHPDLVRQAVAEGHEIALHSVEHRYLGLMTDDEQRADFDQSIDLLQQLSGSRPVGHKSPGWRYNEATHRIAQELGLRWVMDIPSGDLPTLLAPDPVRPPLVNLPPSWLADDYSFFVDRTMTPRQTTEFWQDDFEVLYTEGGMLNLTHHPFVSGRPGPSRALADFLDYVIDLGDVWIATAGQIANWWLEQSVKRS